MNGLVDAVALALLLNVQPATIRQWARRGKLTRRGQDKQGRTLYAIAEARSLSAKQAAADGTKQH